MSVFDEIVEKRGLSPEQTVKFRKLQLAAGKCLKQKPPIHSKEIDNLIEGSEPLVLLAFNDLLDAFIGEIKSE